MKSIGSRISISCAFLAILCAVHFCSPVFVQGEEASIANVTSPNAIRDALQKLKGKSVTLKVNGGEVTGMVGDTGDNYVHIAELGNGQQFYAAVVKLDAVDALIYRAK